MRRFPANSTEEGPGYGSKAMMWLLIQVAGRRGNHCGSNSEAGEWEGGWANSDAEVFQAARRPRSVRPSDERVSEFWRGGQSDSIVMQNFGEVASVGLLTPDLEKRTSNTHLKKMPPSPGEGTEIYGRLARQFLASRHRARDGDAVGCGLNAS